MVVESVLHSVCKGSGSAVAIFNASNRDVVFFLSEKKRKRESLIKTTLRSKVHPLGDIT